MTLPLWHPCATRGCLTFVTVWGEVCQFCSTLRKTEVMIDPVICEELDRALDAETRRLREARQKQ